MSSGDDVLNGATIEVEVRQISTEASTSIESQQPVDPSPDGRVGNATVVVKEPGRPLVVKMTISPNENNSVSGNVQFKAEIKAVVDRNGNRMDIATPAQGGNPARPAQVNYQPKFKTFDIKLN